MSFEILQASDFRINWIVLKTENGVYDISNVFDELSIFDNMLTPCMSGHILIKDAVGLLAKLKIDGNEFIHLNIDKGENTSTPQNNYDLGIEKVFRVYKVTDKAAVSATMQAYVIHFTSVEFLLSEQKKISSYYKSTKYSDVVNSIITQDLNVSANKPTSGNSGINYIEQSSGVHEVVMPTLKPFDAIKLCAKRSIAVQSNKPEMIFFENKYGYTFTSLSTLYKERNNENKVPKINFSMKNINDNVAKEFLGAKTFKILGQMNVADSVKGY